MKCVVCFVEGNQAQREPQPSLDQALFDDADGLGAVALLTLGDWLLWHEETPNLQGSWALRALKPYKFF